MAGMSGRLLRMVLRPRLYTLSSRLCSKTASSTFIGFDHRLVTFKDAFYTDYDQTRILLKSIKLPSNDTDIWVHCFLSLPWSVNGENYIRYPIGEQLYDWLLEKRNAEAVSGTSYVYFCRILNEVATDKQISEFILNTLSPAVISKFSTHGSYHFLGILFRRIGKDIPQGLRDAIEKQITFNWKSSETSFVGRKGDVSMYWLLCCMRDAKRLGIPLERIVYENSPAVGNVISVTHDDLMGRLELHFVKESREHSKSYGSSLKLHRKVLEKANLPLKLPEARFMEADPRHYLEPQVADDLFEYFREIHRTEQNPLLKSLYHRVCLQLVEMLIVYHIQYQLKVPWTTGEPPYILPWSGWKNFGMASLYDTNLSSVWTPILRVLAHVCYKLSDLELKDTSLPKMLGLMEMMWQVTDSAGFIRENLTNEPSSIKPCLSKEAASNYRHVYSNNPKVVNLDDFWDAKGRSKFLRWTPLTTQLLIAQTVHVPKRTEPRSWTSLSNAIEFCTEKIIQSTPPSSFSYQVYLFLKSSQNMCVKVRECAQSWIRSEKSVPTLLHALRDGIRAGLFEDALVKTIITKLYATHVKAYSTDDFSKFCLLHIHMGHTNLPKGVMFSIFNHVHAGLQDSKKILHYAQVLPDVLYLLSKFKVNQQTQNKALEMCHLMMHYTKDLPRVARALVEVYTRLVLPPTPNDSCEDIHSGRILPYSTVASASWLDKVQVQKFIEKAVKEIGADEKESLRCLPHKVSDIVNLCELCITLRHNSSAVDGILSFQNIHPACDIELYRLALTFGKSCASEMGKKLEQTLSEPLTEGASKRTFLCAPSEKLTLNNLLPLFASLGRYGTEKDQQLMDITLQSILKATDNAKSKELRFLLDLSRSEGSFMEKSFPREVFLDAQKRFLGCVSSQIQNNTATLETVTDALTFHIGTAHTSYDSELRACLTWISSHISNESSVEHIVLIVKMMAQSGYRDEGILRRSLERFVSLKTQNAYHVISILSSLRKLEIHDLYDRDECVVLIKNICEKLRALSSVSGRLVASVLTSLSVLVQTVGASHEITSGIQPLFRGFADVLRKEAPTMDCITLSAIFVACGRLNLRKSDVFPLLFERATCLDWAKYPKQTVHFILGAAEIDPTNDILTFLLFSEHIALAIRCILDSASSYKNLYDAVRLVSRVPDMDLQESPAAKLVLDSSVLQEEKDQCE